MLPNLYNEETRVKAVVGDLAREPRERGQMRLLASGSPAPEAGRDVMEHRYRMRAAGVISVLVASLTLLVAAVVPSQASPQDGTGPSTSTATQHAYRTGVGVPGWKMALTHGYQPDTGKTLSRWQEDASGWWQEYGTP